ncbi:MAG: YidC/Oxa1 family insertase periplasmic-domain containing protein [Phycisphaerae bacterium]|jgi:YidC/Oxa1 family membrane protein insertase|nr:YidC/Oxa1 family insertase periplasmic-domain containing protein [Phycisphaerae bacterium]
MTPTARKVVSTVVTLVVAALIFAAVLRPTKPAAPTTPSTSPSATTPAAVPAEGAGTAQPSPSPNDGATSPGAGVTAPTQSAPQAALVAQAPSGPIGESPAPIGSLDPTENPYRIEFAPNGAGIRTIVAADFWRSASSKFAAAEHRANSAKPMPPDSERHVLAAATPLHMGADITLVPVLAAHTILVNGTAVDLFGRVWSELAPGHFATELVGPDGKARFRIERRFELAPKSYDLSLHQTVTNLTDAPATIRWIQYGPSELPAEAGASIEVRRFHFGYLHNKTRDAAQEFVLTTGQMFEHSSAASVAALPENFLWRNADAIAGDFSLSWYGTTSRYFAFALHAPRETLTTPLTGKSLRDRVERVSVQSNGSPVALEVLLLSAVHSPDTQVQAGQTANFDFDVYAGPLDPKVLAKVEPYLSLGMRQAIVYALSSCCSFCTFPWLANLMVAFLGLLHDYLVFDWGLAIIVLVIVVRTLLHPIMKSSQIKMQRFGRAMAELKPELDALQKRYKDDPKTLQLEQMRLYREKRVNPAGCVSGILPTFLQMPIWIALYAVLYFAIDLRQAQAFFGLFQNFGGWAFLGDLSRPDNFFEFSSSIDLGLFKLHGINLLPLLLGVVFFIQQKYMTPPVANMTPEQESQQKMMKVMMVGLFPIMMYAMPSGLTLYILTSTCIGIVESKRVKAHIEKYGLVDPPKAAKKGVAGEMYARMLEKQKAKDDDKPKRTFKERD